jgi:hypothetical protein
MRTTVKKGNRYIHNSWAFHQLGLFIVYKAEEADYISSLNIRNRAIANQPIVAGDFLLIVAPRLQAHCFSG